MQKAKKRERRKVEKNKQKQNHKHKNKIIIFLDRNQRKNVSNIMYYSILKILYHNHKSKHNAYNVSKHVLSKQNKQKIKINPTQTQSFPFHVYAQNVLVPKNSQKQKKKS